MNIMNMNMNMNTTIGVPSPISISKKYFLKPQKTFRWFKCHSNRNSDSDEKEINDDFKDAVSGIVGEQFQELLNRKENKVLLDGLEKASQRVEDAKRKLAFIEKQELAMKQYQDYIQQLEGKASEIAECQREISEAKGLIEEAERSLSPNVRGAEEIDREEERWESVKAASISAIVGTISGLPICFTQVTNPTQLVLPLAINFISCALFGVTFRYTIRRNFDDVQLKTGVAAAFGVVKGLATLSGGSLLELNPESLLSHAWDGTIYVSENLFIFLSAAVALDYCFKTRLLNPFPMDR